MDYREQYRQLRSEILQIERRTLLEARTVGTYSSRTINRAQEALDIEEARMTSLMEASD